MKTDDLIAALAADTRPPRPVASRLLTQAGAGLILSAGLVLAALGLRPDLGAAMVGPVTSLKWLLPLALSAAGLIAALRLSRPTALPRLTEAWLPAGIAAFSAFLLAAALARMPADLRLGAVMGDSAAVCLISVIAIGSVPLGLGLAVLRGGASPRPGLSGAMAGLAAGGAAAAAYAMHCDEDAPSFFLVWYGIGIIAMTTAGWAIGRRTLRW